MDFIYRIFGHGAHTVPRSDTHTYLESLKEQYGPVLRSMEVKGVTVDDLHLEGERLVIHGRAPSAEARRAVLGLIDLLDQNRRDLSVEITVRSPDRPGRG
jgi:hypothetical protein